MSDEIKVVSKNKINKTLIIGAAVLLTLALIVVLIIFVPKAAEARRVEEQLSLGEKYLSELEYEQAIATYLAVIEIDPKNVDAYLGLADAYIAQGEYDKAIVVLEGVLGELDGEAKESVRKKIDEVRAKREAVGITPTPTPEPTVTPSPTPQLFLNWEGTDGNLQVEIRNGECSILGLVDADVTDVVIPEEIKGCPVVEIGEEAFFLCDSISNISMPEGVSSIGDGAFMGCSSLSSIVIPKGVASIGEYVFNDCSSLNSIVIPEGVTSIGEYAFCDCSSLSSIVIPEGVTSIGEGAFSGCSSISSITIPASVCKIGETAFGWCDSLVEMKVSEKNKNYVAIDGILYDKDLKTIICVPVAKELEEYVVINSVERIADGAFSGCSSLSSIVISEGVTSIGVSAFKGCNSLSGIVIPEGVTSIGDEAFMGCNSLRSIVIPGGVIDIGDGAFMGCNSLRSIVIPEGVTSIGRSACRGCSSLNSIYIPNTVTRIMNNAFLECENLTIVTPADSYAEQYAIENGIPVINEPMTSVPTPAVESAHIEYRIDVSGPTTSTSMTTPTNMPTSTPTSTPMPSPTATSTPEPTATPTPIEEGSIAITLQMSSDCFAYATKDKQYVCTGLSDKGKELFLTYNSAYRITLELPALSDKGDVVTGFYSNNDTGHDLYSLLTLESAYLELVCPDSYVYYGIYLGIPRNIDSRKLVNVVLNEGMLTIDQNAFRGWSGLTEFIIPESVVTIGDYAFYDCENLSFDIVEVGGRTVGGRAFGNVKINTLQMSSNMKGTSVIGSFQEALIERVVIREGVTKLPNTLFASCNWLTEISLPSTITTIGENVFRDCQGIIEISIPESVASLGKYMFYDCENIKRIYIPVETQVGFRALENCPNVTIITPAGSYAETYAIEHGIPVINE